MLSLSDLVHHLQQSVGIRHKQDIQCVAASLNVHAATVLPPSQPAIPVGDDCAAIPDGDGYLLLAAEGILPAFLETDPWFAGWSAVMVNVSDIYAMGGRPIAVVDTLWTNTTSTTTPILEGMQAAARTYQVPIVGGHTNCHSPYTALSVAILGRAQQLITSFNARPGDRLLVAVDLRGQLHPTYAFWNASTHSDPTRLREDLAVLPYLAESGLCDAGKDISMGGIAGTLLMLLEASGCGATVSLDAIPGPEDVSLDRWLVSFPSYGFLLSVRPEKVTAVQEQFKQRNITCVVVGEVEASHQVIFQTSQEAAQFWDFEQQALTGFSGNSMHSSH